jgi:prevent-host-death family protein
MIVADTDIWIAYLAGFTGRDVDAFETALTDKVLRMAPVVISELLSDPALTGEVESDLASIPVLEPLPGFWPRAGKLRSRLLADGLRPQLADTLIAHARCWISRVLWPWAETILKSGWNIGWYDGLMKRVNINEAKTQLSKYLKEVERGETIILCKHNKPIAELRPIRRGERMFGIDEGKGYTVGPEFFEELDPETLALFYGE